MLTSFIWVSSGKFTYEIIVVDDCSSDDTASIVRESYCRKDTVRLISLDQNEGKGSAVRRGMLAARGAYLLMADADSATDIRDYDKLMAGMAKLDSAAWKPERQSTVSTRSDCVLVESPLGVAIGSRAHLAKDSVAHRSLLRTILMTGFHFFVSLLCHSKIKDTQCGFKLFTRRAAHLLFANLHLERWAFDIELVQLCCRMDIPMVEVAVNWREVSGSKLITKKLDVVTTSITMLRDMLCVRLCYSLGIWKVVRNEETDLVASKSD